MRTEIAKVHTVPAQLPAQPPRRRLLEQHTELRRLLALGVVQALGVVDHRSATSEALRSLVKLIDALFTQHVAEEEALILPVLEEELPTDPGRIERLRAEHERQRAELHALRAWPLDGGDVELAARFDLLARDLLRDIAREERTFLRGDDRPQRPG